MKVTAISKTRGFILLCAAFVTGIVAQTGLFFSLWAGPYFLGLNGGWWLVVYGLAALLLVAGLHFLGDERASFEDEIDTRAGPPGKTRLQFGLAALLLAGMIAVHATYARRDDPYGYFFAAAWVFSLVLLVFGVLKDAGWRPPSRQAMAGWLKMHRAELFVLGTILLAAFLIRFLDVELHPYSFINDEGHMGSGAECILQGQCLNLFDLGWAAQPQPAYLPYVISIGLFGETAFAIRLVSVLIGTLAVLATYLLAREMFTQKVAWLSSLLLSTLPIHVHFSRAGVDNVVDSLMAPLILWLLIRSVKRASTLGFLAAGLVAGFCIYTYAGSILAAGFGVLFLAGLALRMPGFGRAYSRNMMVFVLAAAVVTLPILGYYSTHPDLFLARFKKESILENGKLQSETQTTGQGSAEILARQFELSSLAFIVLDAPNNFFNSPSAYLPPLEALFFVFGCAYALWRIRDVRFLVLVLWFWTVVILGSALTGQPPVSQRILMSLPALVIMIAIGITKPLEASARFHEWFVRYGPGVLLGLLLFIGYTNIRFYFYDYRIGHYYEDTRNELTYESHFYIAPLHTQGRMYLIGNPNVDYLIYESFNYFSPDVEKQRLNNVMFQTLLYFPNDKDVLFIALPDYKADIDLIARFIPDGEWHEVRRRYQPQYVLFYSYKITRQQLVNFTMRAGGYEHLRP